MATFVELLRQQQAAGFQDVAGTEVAATIPIADRLLNEVVAAQLPPNAPVSELRIEARAGNTFVVRARLARPAFLPPFTLTFGIARQPQLPHDPNLVLEPAASGLMSLAGPALRIFDVLPPGVRLVDKRIHVNIVTVLEHRGLADVIPFLQDVRVATEPNRLVLSVRARIPGR